MKGFVFSWAIVILYWFRSRNERQWTAYVKNELREKETKREIKGRLNDIITWQTPLLLGTKRKGKRLTGKDRWVQKLCEKACSCLNLEMKINQTSRTINDTTNVLTQSLIGLMKTPLPPMVEVNQDKYVKGQQKKKNILLENMKEEWVFGFTCEPKCRYLKHAVACHFPWMHKCLHT